MGSIENTQPSWMTYQIWVVGCTSRTDGYEIHSSLNQPYFNMQVLLEKSLLICVLIWLCPCWISFSWKIWVCNSCWKWTWLRWQELSAMILTPVTFSLTLKTAKNLTMLKRVAKRKQIKNQKPKTTVSDFVWQLRNTEIIWILQ